MLYKDIKLFFENNQDLFNKHRNINTGTNHADNISILKQTYNIEFPYGYCFPISQFIFYYLGGYDSDYELKCIKKIPLCINEYNFYTSHWFVQNKVTNEIIDLSSEQFDKLIDINSFYPKGGRANFGFPYFSRQGKRYEKTVPSKQVIRLYREFRKTGVKSDTLEFYLKEYDNCFKKK